MIRDLTIIDTLTLKAELLCWGIKSNPNMQQAFLCQNPFSDRRTGNAGLQLLVGNFVINVPVRQKFAEASPYELGKVDNEFVLLKNKAVITTCQLVEFSQWYGKSTSDGIPMPKILIQEGRETLVADIYNVCDFFKSKEQCAFCAIAPYAKIKKKSSTHIVESLQMALEDNPKYSLHLTGGCTLEPDKGILNYIEVIRSIRKVSNIKICVEMAPPDETEYLDMLVDAGANAFSVNLEIYDDKLRKLFCPAKSKITKKHYIKTWERLMELTGANTVTSALVAGLESPASTLEGAKLMVGVGVIPTILPFRPNDKSLMSNFRRTQPAEIIFISQNVSRLMRKNKMNTQNQPGCVDCKACTLEIDFQNVYDKVQL